jgi:hypothetical protein
VAAQNIRCLLAHSLLSGRRAGMTLETVLVGLAMLLAVLQLTGGL